MACFSLGSSHLQSMFWKRDCSLYSLILPLLDFLQGFVCLVVFYFCFASNLILNVSPSEGSLTLCGLAQQCSMLWVIQENPRYRCIFHRGHSLITTTTNHFMWTFTENRNSESSLLIRKAVRTSIVLRGPSGLQLELRAWLDRSFWIHVPMDLRGSIKTCIQHRVQGS